MEKTDRIIFLDFITGAGLILIIISHNGFLSEYLEAPVSSVMPISFGIIGNLLFFFRSGFGLYKSDKPDWLLFFRRRLTRVIPALFMTTAVITVMALFFFDPLKLGFDGRLNFKTFAANAFGVQEFLNISRINPITWFISYLLLYYSLFPALHKLISKTMPKFFIWSFLIFLFTFFISNIKDYSYLPNISYYLIAFVFGLFFARVLSEFRAKKFYKITLVIVITGIAISYALFKFTLLFAHAEMLNILIYANNLMIATALITLSSLVNFSHLISNFLNFISKYAYYIFLVHIPVIESLNNINNAAKFAVYFILWCTFFSFILERLDNVANSLITNKDYSNTFK